ncbi:hypothetical protein [Variovorax rhizosphaerae]|uniref:Uncharacterized protein n=1 Tax=Variovorax rhizosphaerae TaxID=1836200 RepID=A0ABU8WM46_9BURK
MWRQWVSGWAIEPDVDAGVDLQETQQAIAQTQSIRYRGIP